MGEKRVKIRAGLCWLTVFGILCSQTVGAQEQRSVLPDADSAVRITIHPDWQDEKGYLHIYGVNLWKPVDTEQMQVPCGYPLYCIEPSISVTADNSAYVDQEDMIGKLTNDALSEEGQVKDLIGRVLQAGFTKPASADWYEDDGQIAAYLATKLLIWECIQGNRNERFQITTKENPYQEYFAERLPIWEADPQNGQSVQSWYQEIEQKVQAGFKRLGFAADTEEEAPVYSMADQLILEEDEEALACFSFTPSDSRVKLSREEGRLIIKNPERVKEFTIIATQQFDTGYQAPGALIVFDSSSGEIGRRAQTVCAPSMISMERSVKQYCKVTHKLTTHLRVDKVDPEIGWLSGAHLTIYTAAGEAAASWISSQEPYRVDGLAPGIYYLKEEQAPEGYWPAPPLEFVIEEIEEEQSIQLENKPTQVIIRKTDGNDQLLGGAKLEIQNEARQAVYTWTSDAEAKVITRIPAGRYQIVETQAPDGYVPAESVEFLVSEEPAEEEITVTVENQPIQIEIDKKDSQTGQSMRGVSLELRDQEGSAVVSWRTEAKPKQIDCLPAGSYQVVEIQAPEGYEKAEPLTIEVKAQPGTQKFVVWNQPKQPEKRQPVHTNPQTGDQQPASGYGLLAGVTAAILLGLFLFKRAWIQFHSKS